MKIHHDAACTVRGEAELEPASLMWECARARRVCVCTIAIPKVAVPQLALLRNVEGLGSDLGLKDLLSRQTISLFLSPFREMLRKSPEIKYPRTDLLQLMIHKLSGGKVAVA